MAMKNSNKRQLITSMMSLGLSVTMLMGTTLAWFTDSATSTGNIIKSGNLKVDLVHHGNNPDAQNDDVSIKRTPNHKIFNYDRWEPGYTQVETLTIKNEGNLALEYAMNASISGEVINGTDGEKLSDVIDVYMAFGEEDPKAVSEISETNGWCNVGTLTQWLSQDNLISGKILPAGTKAGEDGISVGECTVTVALHMREEAGNKYQGLSLGEIGLELNAKQWTYEKDSIGDQYDKDSDSTKVVYATPKTLQTELDKVVNNTVIHLVPGTYTNIELQTPKDTLTHHNIKNLKIVGGNGVVVEGLSVKHNNNNIWKVDGLTIEHVNFKNKGVCVTQEGSGHPQMPNLTMRNCTFVGQGKYNTSATNKLLSFDGNTNAHTFENLLIEGCKVSKAYQGIYVEKADSVTIRNCTFEDIAHNAVALQSNTYGTNIIEGNTIKNCANRAFRIGTLDIDSTVTYKNNTLVKSGLFGENFKVNTLKTGSTVKFEGNTLNTSPWAEGVIFDSTSENPTI